jgi:hypothetical protein
MPIASFVASSSALSSITPSTSAASIPSPSSTTPLTGSTVPLLRIPSLNSDSSTEDERPRRPSKKMPPHPKNTAYVEQDSSSKPPVLHLGDITLFVMREFEDGCVGYFETKEIPEDKHVRKILAGLCDSRIRDWISTDRNRILALPFDSFMTEFRAAYLDDNWEEAIRRELGGMAQGGESFWDYAIAVQAKNSLLTSTPSHLNNDQLRHRLEAGMGELLARRCANTKVNQEKSLKKWLTDVKRVDDLMRAERKEFEVIAQATRETTRRNNPLGEPSNRVNTNAHTNAPRGGGNPSNNSSNRLPKLTENECQLLFNNDSCLKC